MQWRGEEWHFYPRPPRGGRQTAAPTQQYVPVISIHALREEGDPSKAKAQYCAEAFLSTPSARRATPFCQHGPLHLVISIHALREEGDAERGKIVDDFQQFLSTPSARRATFENGVRVWCNKISIHALREEGDHGLLHAGQGHILFLSTPSARRATAYPRC